MICIYMYSHFLLGIYLLYLKYLFVSNISYLYFWYLEIIENTDLFNNVFNNNKKIFLEARKIVV